MDTDLVNADRTQPAVVHGSRLPWIASPQAGVERRMLERIGGEVALATSIVRYAAGSRFDAHAHDMGEEFLVLKGTFSDEHGHYPAGTYVRNPPGSRHRPFSDEGCVIFVKLRQMDPDQVARVVLRPADMLWSPGPSPLCRRALLHSDARESVHMELLAPGCTMPAREVEGGEETLVVDGAVALGEGAPLLQPWSWWRNAAVPQPPLRTGLGALTWVKRGHLAAT